MERKLVREMTYVCPVQVMRKNVIYQNEVAKEADLHGEHDTLTTLFEDRLPISNLH